MRTDHSDGLLRSAKTGACVMAMLMLTTGSLLGAPDASFPSPVPPREIRDVPGAPFPNADFEHGDWRNWPVHEGWVLRDYGNDPDVTGAFTAHSIEGTGLISFYMNRDVNQYPKRLVSARFTVTRPFLTFYLGGRVGYGRKHIGVDTNGDGQPDVTLPPRGRRAGRQVLDLSAHLGKEVAFAVTIEKPKGPKVDLRHADLAVDGLLLEDAPPAVVSIADVVESRESIACRLHLANKHRVASTARGDIRVVDYWGVEQLHRSFEETLAAGKSRDVDFTFPNGGAPQYRIAVTIRASNGQVTQHLKKRYYTAYRTDGRPCLRLGETGWKLALSSTREEDLPAADAAWQEGSPYKFNGHAFWRHGSWTAHEESAQHWYATEIKLPAEFAGQRALLRIDAAYGPLAIFVNGDRIGEHLFRGREDRAFDISRAARAGANAVVLRFRNPNVFGRDANNSQLYPYEKRFGKAMLGILGQVTIEAVPDIHLEDILIDPSWRDKSLTLRMTLRNAGEAQRVTVVASVVDPQGNKRLLTFDPIETEAPPGISQVTCRAPWPDPVCWSPDEPTLLRLTTQVICGGAADTVHERFGFAEWYPEGTRYMLNGKPVTLFVSHALDPLEFDRLKQREGMNSIRSVGTFDTMDACDEEGIAIRGIYVAGHRQDGDGCLAVQREQTLAMQRYYYNHPSMFLWAVGNELGHASVGPNLKLRAFYRDLITEMQDFDPARASSSDGDLDMWGASEVWSIHYPHEAKYEEPNRGYFVKEGVELMDWFAHPAYGGKKPVLMTELFTGGLGGPDWYAPLMGDAAYTPMGPFDGYKLFARWRMQAYREQGVALFEPFEPYTSYRNAWPVDLFLKNFSRNVVAGGKATYEAVLLNGTFGDRELELVWQLGTAAPGRRVITLPPGPTHTDLELAFPTVTERVDVPFTMALLQDGKPFARWGRFDTEFHVFPERRLTGRVACWGLDDERMGLLREVGLEPVPVHEAGELADTRLLITVPELGAAPEAAGFRAWVQSGGYALMLADRARGARLPGGLKLSAFANTMAHVAAPNHPLLAGLGPNDFRHWGADHHVSLQAFPKPSGGGAKVLVQNGTPNGLTLASLVEVPEGRGAWLLSSLLLSKKSARPVAQQLLANALARSTQPLPAPVRTGLLVSDALTEQLAAMNLNAVDLAQLDPAQIDLAAFELLVVDARVAGADFAALLRFVESGGRLMLLRLTPEVLDRYAPLLPSGLTLQPADDSSITGAAILRAGADPLLDGISNYELLWKRGNYQRGGPKFRVTAMPADHDIVVPAGAEGVDVLLEPAVLVRARRGRGEVLLSQFRWAEALPAEQKSALVLSTLLANLGAGFGTVDHAAKWETAPLALRGNAPLARPTFAGVKGPVALLESPTAAVRDIPFRLPEPRGSAVALQGGGVNNLPASAVINVGARADRVAFLHATAFGYVDYDMGKNVFRYLLTLKEGDRKWVEEVNAIYARNVYEYIGDDPGTVNAAVQATRSAEAGVSTYLMTWDNPSPNAVIERVEIKALSDRIATVVLGVTLLKDQTRRRVVERRREGPYSAAQLEGRSEDEPGRRWAILGAMPGAEAVGLNETARDADGARVLFDTAFPPEGQKQIDLKAPVFIRGERYAWKTFVEPEEVDQRGTYVKYRCIRIDDLMDKSRLGKSPAWTCYFYTRVYRDIYGGAPERTAIAFGSDDAGKIWVNGKLVHEKWAGAGRASVLGEDLVFVNLFRGWNDVLVKVVNTQFTGAYSFDLKKAVPGLEAEWRKKTGVAYVQSLPTLGKTSYDCLGKRIYGDAQRTIARVLSVTRNAQSYELEGLGNGDVSRDSAGVFAISWPDAAQAGLSVPMAHKQPAFKQGTFGLLLRVPPGGAMPRLIVAARNAGGINRGDTFIFLQGGQPARLKGKTPSAGVPYKRLVINVDRGAADEEPQLKLTFPLPGAGLPEGVWVPLVLSWGKQGIRAWVNNKLVGRHDEDLPMFIPRWCGLSLLSATPREGGSKVQFQKAFLTDEVLSGPEAAQRLE